MSEGGASEGGASAREPVRKLRTLQPLSDRALRAVESDLCNPEERPALWKMVGAPGQASRVAQLVLGRCLKVARDHSDPEPSQALVSANLHAHLRSQNLVAIDRRNFTTALSKATQTIPGHKQVIPEAMGWILNGRAGEEKIRHQTQQEADIARRILGFFFDGEWLREDQHPTDLNQQPNYFWPSFRNAASPARFVEIAAALRIAAAKCLAIPSRRGRVVNVTGCEPFRANSRISERARTTPSNSPSHNKALSESLAFDHIWDAIADCARARMHVVFVVPSPCPRYLRWSLREIRRRIATVKERVPNAACEIRSLDVSRPSLRLPRPDGAGKEERWPWEYFGRQWRYIGIQYPLAKGYQDTLVNVRPALAGYALNFGMHDSDLEGSHFWTWADGFLR